MKYNTLEDYKDFLCTCYTKATAETYFKCMEYLLSDQYIIDCKNINIEKLLQKLESMRYKNQYSKYKNAFLKFCEFQNIKLDNNTLLSLDIMKLDKKKKYRKLNKVRLTDIKNKIKVIRDKRLKLSYETMLATGLRVSELSQIKKADCITTENSILFRFIAKGGKKESVQISAESHKRLFNDLVKLIEDNKQEKLFYSSNYLQKEATKRGFQCHDLRRAFAKIEYKKNRNLDKVRLSLRHKSIKNTKIYLKSKVEI